MSHVGSGRGRKHHALLETKKIVWEDKLEEKDCIKKTAETGKEIDEKEEHMVSLSDVGSKSVGRERHARLENNKIFYEGK